MAFADLDWYLMVAQTIDTIYREELNRPSEPLGNANWIYHAREGGKDAAWIRDQVRQSEEWHAIHDPKPGVDPYSYSNDQLLKVRGALFTVKSGSALLPYGPRPMTPDNVAFFGAPFYTKEQRQVVYDLYHARGYTHGPIGPFIDPGYHGQTPPIDFRGNPDAVVTLIEEVWDNHLIPVVFITPDGWTVDQLKTLEPIFRSARWQRACRVVCNGYEQQGTPYGWSNAQYVEYLTWLRDVFPTSVRFLHTVANIEAPVGNGDDTSKPGMSNGECWGRVTPLIHGWLEQSDALFHATNVDPHGDGRTDEAHWRDLWDKRNPHSLVQRFNAGTAGWPTTSANGGPMKVYAGEFLSYLVYWHSVPEDLARDYGRDAITLGADGAFDGCRP